MKLVCFTTNGTHKIVSVHQWTVYEGKFDLSIYNPTNGIYVIVQFSHKWDWYYIRHYCSPPIDSIWWFKLDLTVYRTRGMGFMCVIKALHLYLTSPGFHTWKIGVTWKECVGPHMGWISVMKYFHQWTVKKTITKIDNIDVRHFFVVSTIVMGLRCLSA